MNRLFLVLCIAALLMGAVGQRGLVAEARSLAQDGVPDLRVTNAIVTVPDAANPARVRIEVTVGNEGTAPSEAFTIRWYPHIYQMDIVGCSVDSPGLNVNAKGTARCSYTYPGGDTGQIYWLTVADPDDELEELKETNNKMAGIVDIRDVGAPPPPPSGGGPDLVILDPHFEPAQASPGQPFKAVMTVRNAGNGPAGAFASQWHFHDALGLEDCNWDIVQGLGPGASARLSCARTTNIQPGQGPTALTVDRDNTVVESDEANNDASLTLVVKAAAPGPKPDLVILDPHFEPAQASPGQPFKAVMTVRNEGSGSAGSFASQWHFHDALGLEDCNWDMAQGLGPGASARLSCARTTDVQPGQGPTTLTVDRDNTVVESEEANNDAALVLIVTGPAAPLRPDLVIQEAGFDPARPISGQPFSARVVVKNQGQVAAGTFQVAWKFDAGAGVDNCTWTVDGGLQAGATKSLGCTRERNGPPGSTVPSTVRVDGPNAIDEADENNNAASPNLTLDTAQVVNAPAGGPPDLVIEDLLLSPSTLKPSMELAVSFRVVNRGNSPAGASRAEWRTPPGGGLSWTCQVPSLLPGKSHSCSTSFMAGPSKIANFGTTATADVGNAVNELREDNNQAKTVLTVKN